MGCLVAGRQLVLLGLFAPLALSGCAPRSHDCTPDRDVLDRARSPLDRARNPAGETVREVRPVGGAVVAALAATGVLAGHRCD